MATPAFGTAMASMLQTRSQTLTFRATVMDASTDDGTCIVRLAQGGVRRVVVPAGVKVEYGATVNVSRVIGRNQLVLVGAGSTTVSTTVNNITQSSSGGGGASTDVIAGEFLSLDASNGPLTGPLESTSTISATQLISTSASGLPPLSVASQDRVVNLNADTVDGYHADWFVERLEAVLFTSLTLDNQLISLADRVVEF